MKIPSHQLAFSFAVGLSALLAHGHSALAYWSGPTYTIKNRVCTPANNSVTTTTYPPQAGGATTEVNNPNGATVSAKWTWVASPYAPNEQMPTDVYVLQYGKASWNMSPPNQPAGMTSQPSFQEVSFSPRQRAKLQLVQAQQGSGTATNGLGVNGTGDAQVVTTAPDGWRTGISEGYKAVLLHPTNGVITTTDVVLLASATNGPGQSYMPAWQYNAQVINATFTCNNVNITSPNPAYQTTVGLKNALVFSMTGAGITVTDPQWSLPSKYIKDWVHKESTDNTNPGAPVAPYAQEVPVPATELASTSIPKLFWVSGGTKAITFTAKVNGKPFNITGNVNVTKPQVAFSVSPTGTIAIGPEPAYGDSNTYLHYGVPASPTAGITYGVSPNLNAGGPHVLTIAQVITSNIIQVTDGNNAVRSWTKTSGLDTVAVPGPGVPPFAVGISDAPAQGVTNAQKEVYMNQTFKAWLMYNPPSTGTEHDEWIFVPLKQLTWSWSGRARRRGTAWAPTSTVSTTAAPTDLISAVPATAAPQTGVDNSTNVYPSWAARIQEGTLQ